jgi:hypothetical protein
VRYSVEDKRFLLFKHLLNVGCNSVNLVILTPTDKPQRPLKKRKDTVDELQALKFQEVQRRGRTTSWLQTPA